MSKNTYKKRCIVHNFAAALFDSFGKSSIAAGAHRLHNARFKLCNDFRIRNEHKPLILCVHCRRCTERGIPKQRNLLLGEFFVRVGANAAAFKHRFDNIVYMCL